MKLFSYHNQTYLVAVCVARRFGMQGQVRKLSGIVWGARIVRRCVGKKFIAHCSMLIDQAGGRSTCQIEGTDVWFGPRAGKL